jgi:hypothetical protein
MERSKMVEYCESMSTTGCQECRNSHAAPLAEIKFRFSKDRILLCRECWFELDRQIKNLTLWQRDS